MTPAVRILTAVAADLDRFQPYRTLTVHDLNIRVISTAHRIYNSVSSYTAHRQAKAALAIAPAIKPNSSRTSYLTALKGILR